MRSTTHTGDEPTAAYVAALAQERRELEDLLGTEPVQRVKDLLAFLGAVEEVARRHKEQANA